ncbi:DNA-directed RNA polymerase I core subunit [Starmerella bacillaris]|uniref:DNA-directed RNA polymerase subunit n=1 Tax=Starmerella bacillaris TaxID=1247836 RepID=A0AAV5RJU4_STABA|nr:DNA-directed RNA polymerase I core subunit [Starmerella bacillaris]
MDIATAVGEYLESVDFKFLNSHEIKTLSVKQILSAEVFDNLGHPVTNGLYDLCLGAFGQNLCQTCGLNEKKCMGHVGHVNLPVPVFNPMVFPQMYLLLRSSCMHCLHFKLNKEEKHLFECKLRLLQYGLILESSEVQDISSIPSDSENDLEALDAKLHNTSNTKNDTMDVDSSEKKSDAKDIVALRINARTVFVENKIAAAIQSGFTSPDGMYTPTISEERKKVLKELFTRLLSRPKCDNCGMYSPKFRKDGVSKIFETGLSDKQLKSNTALASNVKVSALDLQEYKLNDKLAKEVEEPLGNFEIKLKSQHGNRYMSSFEICNLMRQVFRFEQKLCSLMFNSRPSKKQNNFSGSKKEDSNIMENEYVSADIFFANVIMVPPTRFRLPSELGDDLHMNPLTELMQKIVQTSLRILEAKNTYLELQSQKDALSVDRKNALTMMVNQFIQLQNDYNGLVDSTKNASATGLVNPGIKQTLERKEGLFRKNMMGKRVNYAARSVISPDPNIETNEIGVPLVFALKLTYPEPVTLHNAEELRKAVINGPDTWPGATIVQNEFGQQTSLANMTLDQRTAVANQLTTPASTAAASSAVTGSSADSRFNGSAVAGINKKVFRHIRNGDVVLMNRQPTLHKASMMGHIVRVLPKEKTLRLHYANTGAYNADFDGDEMNMHFPQNEAARAEAMLIANTNNQYLTPTSGKPLRGLIQDHISAGVWLTNMDSFFSREEYQQLIYGSIYPESGKFSSGKVLLLPPAVLKPRAMWTGKQLISTLLLNVCPLNRPGLNLKSSNKIKNEYWSSSSKENTVLFKDGELLIGILDKSQYGASDHGLVHAVYEVYGAEYAGLLLSVLGRLFTKFNMRYALTCGMDDLLLTTEGNEARSSILSGSADVGLKAALEVTNLSTENSNKLNPQEQREFKLRLEEILRDDSKLAVLDAVTQSKAGAVTSQVVSTCIPKGTTKQFPRNSMQMMALSGAKGSNVNVSQIMCSLGQQALEGRRVPLMVSGKSLPCFKPFDTQLRAGGYIAQRFQTGVKPQEYYFHCMAGREGLIDTAVKTSRSGYLQRCLIKQLEGVHVEYDNTVRDYDGTLLQFMYGGDSIDTTKESYLDEFEFCKENMQSLLHKHVPSESEIGNLDDTTAASYLKKQKKREKKSNGNEHSSSDIDPVTAVYNPSKYIGAVSTSFQQKLEKKADEFYPDKEQKKLKKKFISLMQLKYQQSTVNPGEQVGIVASQSIGEPSTQMTLNTFHFAGHGAANVTLGIPRMREIIMTASANIKTPQMSLQLQQDISDAAADAFAKSITKIVLSQLIDKVIVKEKTSALNSKSTKTARKYSVRIELYTKKEYEEEYDVSQHDIEQILSNKFLFMLEESIAKEVRKQRRIDQSIVTQIGVANKSEKAGIKADSQVNDIDDSGDEDVNSDNEEEESNSKDDVVASDKQEKEEAELGEEEEEDKEVEDIDLKKEENETDESENSSENSDAEMDTDSSVSDVEVSTPSKPVVAATSNYASSTSSVQRQKAVLSMHRTISAFNFDDEDGQWCEFDLEFSGSKKLLMVNLIEDLCRKVVVRETKNIDRCLRTVTNGKSSLITEGVNFKEMWQEDLFIKPDEITSNDVNAVLHTYGVEAARQTIVNEIGNVFKTYAIAVNQRHLDLIADMMTREGTYLPFSRQGLDSSTSPFLKMSFESTCQFLTKTVLNGDHEDLKSPSARIVIGRPFKGGTGAFDLMTRL